MTKLCSTPAGAVLVAIMGSALDEVVCPDMARIFRAQPDARSIIQPQPAALRLPLRHLQTLSPPDALDPFAVHRPPGRAQQCCHPTITVPPVLLGQGNDVLGQRLLVVSSTRHLALRRSTLPEHPAYPPLRRRQYLPHMIDASRPARRA